MSKDFTLIIFVVLATLSSGLLGSAALAAVRGSARIPLKAIVSSGAVSLAVGAGLSLATLGPSRTLLRSSVTCRNRHLLAVIRFHRLLYRRRGFLGLKFSGR